MSDFNFTAQVNVLRNPTGNLQAFATLVVNGVVAIDNFRIIRSRDGNLFVSAPSHKGKDKEGNDTWYNDVRFFEDKEEGKFRGPIADAAFDVILNEYNRAASGSSDDGPTRGRQNAAGAHQGRQGGSNNRPASRRDPVDW